MASELTSQQLITQSAQATADAIASALTARTASISLSIYDWDSKDAYYSFSIFGIPWRTVSSLTASCLTVRTTSDMSLQPWEQNPWRCMHNGCLLAAKEELRATKVKASVFLNRIQQGMMHNINTHLCLGELKDVIARWGEGPQDLVICIKTLMDHCEMIDYEHQEHKLHHHIICAYCLEGKLLGKLMAKPFKMPSSELADIAMNHFTIQHAWDQVSHSSKPMNAICHNKHQAANTTHNGNGHTPPAPPKNCPNCTQQHPAGRTNCPAWDSCCSKCNKIGHWGPKCCGGKPPQLKNAPLPRNASPKSVTAGSPDAHIGATTATLTGVVKQMP